MKIIISGYGRMGRQVEKTALLRGHEIMAILDKSEDFTTFANQIAQADVAIDFSMPESVVDNILRFFETKIPVVVGTTGWYGRFEFVEKQCIEKKCTLLCGTNMSIGVNLFFELNRTLAKLMHPYSEYVPSVEETHHVHKKDAPSGTAITLAEDILKQYNNFTGWTSNPSEHPNKLPILAFREGEVVGNHIVTYKSDVDEISISHQAFNREGFALGAVCAAEWLPGHCGIFTMHDVIKSLSE